MTGSIDRGERTRRDGARPARARVERRRRAREREDDVERETNSFGSVRERKSGRGARATEGETGHPRARARHGDRERAKTTKPTSERDGRGGERETIDEA